MTWLKRFACLCMLAFIIAGCNTAAPQPPVEQGLLNAENPEVFVRAGAAVTAAPMLPGRVPVADGASIGALQNAVGRYTYSGCLDQLIFGATNGAKMDVKDDSAGNFSLNGSQLVSKSSGCPAITITTDGNPPEARVSTIGTVFFVAYDSDKHITLLWTLVGAAALTNIQANGQSGETTGVPNGFWSVVRDHAEPESPQPVAQMGPIIDELGLRDIYDLIVEIMETEGFGSSAPGPQNIATIVPPTATPTPTRAPTRIPTNTATNIPSPTVRRPPTATRTRVIIPTDTATSIPSATATDTPPPSFTPTPTTTPFISFRADRTTINQGESTTLRWDVEGVDKVYFEGADAQGHGSRVVTPNQTQTYTLRVVPVSGPDQFYPLTITVIPVANGWLQGYVHSSTTSIANARVELSDGQTQYTASDGFFEFSGVKPGTYSLSIFASGYLPQTVTVTISPDGSEKWITLERDTLDDS
jgi:hypothetical protein